MPKAPGGEPGTEAWCLNSDTVCAYLRETGRLAVGEPCAATRLGGGVSNEVVRVESSRGRWVVKQALPRLRVASEWLADASRSEVEARCLVVLGELLPTGCTPDLLFSDPARHVLAMSAAPASMRNLKDALLGGLVDEAVAAEAGRLLGAIQAGTCGRADLAADFGDIAPFRQLRLAPYYAEVARRHAELAGVVLNWAATAENERRCLVHGDYSPKNMLFEGRRLLLLDFEVAHWGCRAFDPAFFINHLLLKSLHLPSQATAFGRAAAGFWDAFRAAAGWSDGAVLEAEVMGHLGCLLLARVDGKSPVEYITAEAAKERVRSLAREILGGGLTSLAAAFAAGDAATR